MHIVFFKKNSFYPFRSITVRTLPAVHRVGTAQHHTFCLTWAAVCPLTGHTSPLRGVSCFFSLFFFFLLFSFTDRIWPLLLKLLKFPS